MIPTCLLIMLACFALLAMIDPNFMKWICAKAEGRS